MNSVFKRCVSGAIGAIIGVLSSFIVNATLLEVSLNPIFSIVILVCLHI